MDKAQTFSVTLTGINPAIVHNDNLVWANKVKLWQDNPTNKRSSIPGDDRCPSWRWIGYIYNDGKYLTIDSDNLMTMLREGGSKVPTGKGTQTFKSITQSGMIINEIGWPIVGPKGPVKLDDIMALVDEPDFTVHEATAVKLGFRLFPKHAKIGTKKHIRVRPVFDTWSVSGTIMVIDPRINISVVENILAQAGAFCGLCDWRPSSPKAGRFGTFSAEVKKI